MAAARSLDEFDPAVDSESGWTSEPKTGPLIV